MRPIIRGDRPKDEEDNNVEYTDYKHARGELIRRLGEYCSYCEMHLDSSLAVEHVQPKKPPGATENIQERELDWGNFLLACGNCNATKGNEDVDLSGFFWPDKDNTFLAFRYAEDGSVSVNTALQQNLKDKADITIKLTGLDKRPKNDPADSDRRWKNREEAWSIAQRSKKHLERCSSCVMKEQITLTAIALGYWSVWMTVFKDDQDMCQRFLECMPGTARDCFDNQLNPINRAGGQI